MKIFDLNKWFIRDHMDELIHLEDYLPFSLVEFDTHRERDAFLESKNLLKTINEMEELIYQKCMYYADPMKAYNSILIEWLDCHPEFEGVIDKDSYIDYQNMKNSNTFIEFIDLLDDVELPFEKEGIDFSKFDYNHDLISIKDDSNIKYPNFKKMRECYDKYPSTLLASYLAYLV